MGLQRVRDDTWQVAVLFCSVQAAPWNTESQDFPAGLDFETPYFAPVYLLGTQSVSLPDEEQR